MVTLVSNTGQSSDPGSRTLGGENIYKKFAQSFKYKGTYGEKVTLESVGIPFDYISSTSTVGGQLAVTIRTPDSNGNPGIAACTLDDPSNFTTSGVQTFTGHHNCPEIKANQTYFVSVERNSGVSGHVRLKYTSSNAEDSVGQTGWVIGNDAHGQDGADAWQIDSISYQIEVKATIGLFEWASNLENNRISSAWDDLADYTVYQGFRTGNGAALFEVHEIIVDMEEGISANEIVKVEILESSSFETVDNNATPSQTPRPSFGHLPGPTDRGRHVFMVRNPKHQILRSGRNYFVKVSSTSTDTSNSASVQVINQDSQDAAAGWKIDNQSYVKENSNWRKLNHKVKINIRGKYRPGIHIIDAHAYETCHGDTYHHLLLEEGSLPPRVTPTEYGDHDNDPNTADAPIAYDYYKSCVMFYEKGHPDAPPDGKEKPSGYCKDEDGQYILKGDGSECDTIFTWISNPETLDFEVAIWPELTGDQTVTVNYVTADYTTTAGEDYRYKRGTLVFGAGDQSKTVKVEVLDDSHEDSGEQMELRLSRDNLGKIELTQGDGASYYKVARGVAYGTIYNSEEPIEVKYLYVSDVTITEGDDATADFTITLDSASNAPTWVRYTTKDGSAKAGTDYTKTSSVTIIPIGDASVTVSVPISDDDEWTGTREFVLELSDPVNATISKHSGTGHIEDDEPGPLTVRLRKNIDNHDNRDFVFHVYFSEDVSTKYLVMQNDAFDVTGGEIYHAMRVNTRRDLWKISVNPEDYEPVQITLPATEDCSQVGAICTYDPVRPLSHGVTITVGAALKPNTPASGAPAVSGTARVGETLTADASGIADEDGLDNAAFSYQWVSNDGSADSDIENATGSTYELTDNDVGKAVKVRVTFTDDAGNEESLTSEPTAAVADKPNTPATGQPAIGGTAQVGEKLTADVAGIADADGLENAAFSYQWIADDADIDGATTPTYEPTDDDVGKSIRVRVSFADDTGNQESLTSEATATVVARPNTPATGTPAISGAVQVGETLTATVSGIADEDGLSNAVFGYQWLANDADIAGAANSTYTLAAGDEGKTIKVRVSFTDDAGNRESLTSQATAAVKAKPNSPATGLPSISGTAQVGETLTADTAGIADGDGLTNVSYSYQWIAGGADIAGATGSSHTLTSSEQGQTVQVRVTFTDDAGYEESLTSEPTTAVAAAPLPLTVSLEDRPSSHDGTSDFTFEIRFSEEVKLGYKTFRDHVLNVTGGSVKKAQRTDKPSNMSWRITVRPDGNGDVVIELPATTDCNAPGAICAKDDSGRMLSNPLSFTVPGPGQ